jgi:hypothetical protein
MDICVQLSAWASVRILSLHDFSVLHIYIIATLLIMKQYSVVFKRLDSRDKLPRFKYWLSYILAV